MTTSVQGSVSDNASASHGPFGVSALCYGRAEDIWIATIVIPELKFRNIERQIFAANLVISPNHAAFEQRPEAVNRLRVDSPDDVLARTVIDHGVREVLVEPRIGGVIAAAKQTDLVRYGFANKPVKGGCFDVRNDASNDIAFAGHRTSHRGFLGIAKPALAASFVDIGENPHSVSTLPSTPSDCPEMLRPAGESR